MNNQSVKRLVFIKSMKLCIYGDIMYKLLHLYKQYFCICEMKRNTNLILDEM